MSDTLETLTLDRDRLAEQLTVSKEEIRLLMEEQRAVIEMNGKLATDVEKLASDVRRYKAIAEQNQADCRTLIAQRDSLKRDMARVIAGAV